MNDRIRTLRKTTLQLFSAFTVLIVGAAFAADDPTIQVEVSSDEIFVGDSVDYHVVIRNSKNPSAPDLTALKEQFDIASNGDESRNQSSVTIINGQVSQRNVFSHVFHYRLTPKSTGDLTIPAATATIDGKTIKSSEVSLRVIEPEKQDLVLIEIEATPEKVYPTQPFTVTVRILVQPLPNNAKTDPLTPIRNQPPSLQINWVDPIPAGLTANSTQQWLQPLVADDDIGFSLNGIRSNDIFSRGRLAFGLYKGRDSRTGLDGKSIRYFVYELTRTFTPDRAGEYAFGPAIVKGVFVAGMKDGEYFGKRLVAIAAAKSVDVRDVPTPRPESYCGAIGPYTVVSSASPTKLRVGDPLTLTIEFQRGEQAGSLDLISAPDLSEIPQLADEFDLIDKNPTGRVEGPIKRFSYSLRPKKPNVSIPELKIATFDTKSDSFVDIATKPISLEVTEAEKISSGDLVGNMSSSAAPTIKSRSQGIFQNVTDPSELKDERVDPFAWLGLALGIWLAMACLVAIVGMYRHKKSDAGWLRRQQARKSASRKLSDARAILQQGKSRESLATVRSAIVGLVADMQDRIVEGLTTSDVKSALKLANVPDSDLEALTTLLDSIESAEYGGAQTVDPAQAIDNVTRLISRVSPFLERGR